ncbi:hypothetical protein ACRE_089890 [Hapsidospora chrysogenum ATCC 11550]|uniref:Uncharacterized protein n=1 Tax=Hapsidospora chrysogenum (strain ATCC 11550 / CBS 779.69 / DSM 880 / IAM 14645 / JCM 23072 / IMI 49137) TaxID=857340 RepID=A0A086STB1_HAPC1|nr:hypothetical protein ACRE_089890 [Hapsidospora chrysogenum ATCC 11550]
MSGADEKSSSGVNGGRPLAPPKTHNTSDSPKAPGSDAAATSSPVFPPIVGDGKTASLRDIQLRPHADDELYAALNSDSDESGLVRVLYACEFQLIYYDEQTDVEEERPTTPPPISTASPKRGPGWPRGSGGKRRPEESSGAASGRGRGRPPGSRGGRKPGRPRGGGNGNGR